MKAFKKYTLLTLAALTMISFSSCKEEEVYDTSVTRDFQMTLNGAEYKNLNEDSHTYGEWDVFVYYGDGKFKGNYKTQYRFALENGDYKIFGFTCALATRVCPTMTPLNDIYIPQEPEANLQFGVSNVVNYKAGDPLRLDMTYRKGMLRLRSADEKADKSYAYIRTKITTPVTAYHIADEGVQTNYDEPMVIVREKETSGGIGFAEDLLLVGTPDHKVNITIDYLDQNKEVINSKEFAEAFTVLPNDTTNVQFLLNNPDEKVIVDYTVTMGSVDWIDQTEYPSVPVEVPDGYTYVAPADDVNTTIKSLMNDESVDHIRIFLKANEEYSISASTLETITKSISILGQTPGYGQQQTNRVFEGALAPNGNMDAIHFENLNISMTGARMFNIRNQEFNIDEVAFVDCTFADWTGIIWNQVTNGNNKQVVGTVRMEGCQVINYTAASNPLWYLPINYQAPISKFIFKGNLFHGKDFKTRTIILSRLTKMVNPIDIIVEDNTFIDTKGTAFTYFDIDGKAAEQLNLKVNNNIISGALSSGTWFKLGKTTSIEASGNTRTAGYEMNYGVEAPTEVSTTYSELLKQLNL